MFLFFNENGVLKEIINDLPLRQGSDLINRVYVFIDRELPSNVVYSYKYKKPNGEVSESIIFETTETKEIPFNRHRDLYHFKYGKEYKFNYFDIPINALTHEGMISFTISVVDGDFSLSLELLTLNIEEGVVVITESITQSQMTYLMEMIAEYKQLYYDRIDSAESDILKILNGELIVDKAKHDQNDKVIDEHYSTKAELLAEINKIINGTTLVDKAKKDQKGNVIDEKYAGQINFGASTSPTDKKLTIRLYTAEQDKSQTTPNLSSMTYTINSATPSSAGLLPATDKVKLDNLAGNAETTYIKNDTKGVANGVVPLDNNTKIALTYLYDSVLGQLEYVGTFDGATLPSMTQNLSPNRAVRKGDYFIAIGSGIINGVDFEVGDWLIFNSPSTWAKIDNTDAVSLVNNKKGVVVLDGTDINWADDENKTIKAKISEIDIELADIYRKDQVYTKNEIDNLLDQLKAVYGWESGELGQFNHEDKIYIDEIEDYDFLIVNFYDINGVIEDSQPIPVKDILDEVDYINLGKEGEAQINWVFNNDIECLQFQNGNGDEGYYIKVYGVKMEQQLAENITYGHTNVKAMFDDILDGTRVVGKAKKDNEGNEIIYHYAHKLMGEYNDTTNKIEFELQNADGNPLDSPTIELPKATLNHDGLMSKEDKKAFDEINTQARTNDFLAIFDGENVSHRLSLHIIDGDLAYQIKENEQDD